MCGIAGFIAQPGTRPDRSLLQAMCDRIQHRGPDGYGCWFDERAALGHRRLSIIDLEGGSQPMGNEDGRLQVVFNGEIYNFLELWPGLEQRGHNFSTRSDTEVLLHLYEEAGEGLPEHLNGMFAFAIWDSLRQELFLARDRLGKKPLYYSTSIPGFEIAFASELKALTVLPGFDSTVDPSSAADFLSLSYIPDPKTIYRGVKKLPPGHSLLFRNGEERLRRYWQLEFSAGGGGGYGETIDEIRHLSSDAVERRMISDVPLGAFLSGGVDSSGVVAYMARHTQSHVKTFSIGFTVKEFNETQFARLIVDRYRTDHFEKTVTPSIEEMLGVLVEHYDEPFGDSSAIPTLYLSRMTREHVTVALSGDGADEMFGGYRRYFYGVLEERLRGLFPDWFRRPFFAAAGRYYPKFDYLPQVFRAKTLLSNMALDIGDAYFTTMSTFRDQGLDALLAPELRRQLGGYNPRIAYRDRFLKVAHLPPLQQLQAVDVDTYLPGDILVKADRATMAYSLEGRSPWLDYRICELAARLPQAWKLNGRSGKDIFKKSLEPLVPGDILWRSKMGFAVPLDHWFRSSLRPVFEQRVLGGGLEDFLARAEAMRLWQQHQSGLHSHGRKLWNLLMLASWRECHAGSGAKQLSPTSDHQVH